MPALKARLLDVFAIDTRSLAVFRVALALTILADLALRARDLGPFYTDDGVLPRALLADDLGSRTPWLALGVGLVPHFWFGGALGQGFWFVVAGLTAALLLVGWRTRWVTVASWVLLTSLQSRNPVVLNGGDVILRLLLFWSMLLPLGARWSLDAVRTGRRPPDVVTGGAAAALLLQVALIYVFTGLKKTGATWNDDYTALALFLGNGRFGSDWGRALLAYPALLAAMTWITITLERWGAFVALSPLWSGPARMLAVVLFAGLHAGVLVLSTIDLFSVISIVAWTVFVPSWFWTRFGAATGGWTAGEGRRAAVPRWQHGVALALIGYVCLWNVRGLDGDLGPAGRIRAAFPPGFTIPGVVLRLDQSWGVFSPNVTSYTRFVAVRGETAGGRSVDLLREEPSDPERMKLPAGRYARERWGAYWRNLRSSSPRRDPFRERAAAYLAGRWNARGGPDRVTRVRLVRVDEPIAVANGGAGPGPARRTRTRTLLDSRVEGAP